MAVKKIIKREKFIFAVMNQSRVMGKDNMDLDYHLSVSHTLLNGKYDTYILEIE